MTASEVAAHIAGVVERLRFWRRRTLVSGPTRGILPVAVDTRDLLESSPAGERRSGQRCRFLGRESSENTELVVLKVGKDRPADVIGLPSAL